MTITKKILFFLGAVFFLTCSSTYIKVQAAQDMPDKSVQIGKKTTMQVKDSTLSTQNKAAWIWKSSDSSIASVNKHGTVTGKKKGTVTISLKIPGKPNDITASVRVVSYFRTKSIKITNKPKEAMATGDRLELKTLVTPHNARFKKVIFTSSNKKVASVSKKGIVKAKKKGSTTITASVKGTAKRTSFKLKVKKRIKIKKITLSGKNTAHVGEQIALTTTLSPKNTTDDTLVFSSNNPSVATVNKDGVVTSHHAGKVTITVREKESKKKARHHITIEDIPYTSIEFAKNNPVSLESGTSHKMQLVTGPANATDHRIKWTSSNKTAATVDENGTVTALRPIETVTITAVYKTNPALTCSWNLKITRTKGYITKQMLDNLDLTSIKKVMITAHPDDETLWGGGHLIEGEYLVVCMTHGWNPKRRTAFEQTMRTTNDKYLILDYRKTFSNGKYETDMLSTCKNAMQEDINLILSYKKWDLIATHNPFGEYGKFLHKTISQMVTQCYNKMTNKSATLYYFGRYYNSSNKIPGEQIAPELLAIKNSMVGRYYPTAKGAIDAFGHMIPYENWLLPSEW